MPIDADESQTQLDPRATTPADALTSSPVQVEPKTPRAPIGSEHDQIEVSFVMPCLNEAKTIATCVDWAAQCIREHDLKAEIIVGDNGSTDGSQSIARAHGARVIDVPTRGYGAALMGAIDASRSTYVIMGDSDAQHDFRACFDFVEKLRAGHDFVMGSRFAGEITEGSMGWKNRYIGNPALTFVGRTLFGAKVDDFHCGLRAFRREIYPELNVRTTGMEFASEMIIKAACRGVKLTQIPITVLPAGRDGPPHLRPWRDGWRHLRFMLLLNPRWTLGIPGLALMLLGALLAAPVVAGPLTIPIGSAGLTLDYHTLILGAMLIMVGYQAVTVSVAARIYALTEEIGPPAPHFQKLFGLFTLERGLIAGLALAGAGALTIAALTVLALTRGFEPEATGQTIRALVVGATCVVLGTQTALMSFFYSMLGIRTR